MVEGPLVELLAAEDKRKLTSYFHRIIQDERVFAIGFCDHDGKLAYVISGKFSVNILPPGQGEERQAASALIVHLR
jgi:trehalose 6-phosphate synthase